MLAIFTTAQTVTKSGKLSRKLLVSKTSSIKLLSPRHPPVNLAVALLSRCAGGIMFKLNTTINMTIYVLTPAAMTSICEMSIWTYMEYESAVVQSSVRWLGVSAATKSPKLRLRFFSKISTVRVFYTVDVRNSRMDQQSVSDFSENVKSWKCHV